MKFWQLITETLLPPIKQSHTCRYLTNSEKGREYLFSHFVSWWRWHLNISNIYYRCIFFWEGWRKLFLILDFVIYFLNDLFSHVFWKGFSMPAVLIFNTCVCKITLPIRKTYELFKFSAADFTQIKVQWNMTG